MSRKPAPETPPEATTGHEWDGIRELDNPLPRWWLYIFYASIVFSFGYWIAMPAWPGISGFTPGVRHHSDRANVEKAVSAVHARRDAQARSLAGPTLNQIEADPALQSLAMSIGASVFADNCAPCHGKGGTGSKGYANLRDDVWLWGGSLDDIQHTISVGVRSGAEERTTKMPAFGREDMLTPEQISDLTEYVMMLSGRPANAGAVERARQTFTDQCVSCHKADGKGNVLKGAPDLTDREWLYGSRREDITDQIRNGRGGVMPAWNKRLTPEIIKALAVYIHVNAGGQ